MKLKGRLTAACRLTGRIAKCASLVGVISKAVGYAVSYEPGENISIEDNIISVLTADEAEQDNTKPITSAAVHMQIGNIQVLLETI